MKKHRCRAGLFWRTLFAATVFVAMLGGASMAGAVQCPPATFPAVNPASLTDPQAVLTGDYVTPILDATTLLKYSTPLPNPLAPGFIYTPAGTQGGESWYTVSQRQITQSAGLVFNNPANAADPNNNCTAPPATFWTYGDARDNGLGGVAPTAPHSNPGPTMEVTSGTPVRVTWTNELPANHFLSVDPTLDCGPHAPNCWPYNRTVVHVHGAHVADDSDGHPDAWFTAGFAATGHTWRPNTHIPSATTGTYRYENTQEAAPVWYHDHAMGTTHINAYAGLAGFYIVRDASEAALQAPVVGPPAAPAVLPKYPYETAIVIQDKVFDTGGQLLLPNKPVQDFNATLAGVACDPAVGAMPPYACGVNPAGTLLPAATPCDPLAAIGTLYACPTVKFRADATRPGAVVPDPAGTLTAPSVTPEFFGNVIMVNGQAWPKLDVEQRVYRVRMLNGSDSRTYVLRLMLKDLVTGVLSAPPAGFDLWQIGTEQGLLNAPVRPMTNDPSVAAPPAVPPFPQTNAIVLMPGERVDMLIDFSKVPLNSTVQLQNLGPDGPYTGEYPPVAGAMGNGQTPTVMASEIMVFNVNQPLNATTTALTLPAQPLTLDPALIGTVGQRGLRTGPAVIAPLVDTVGTTPKKIYLAERIGNYGRLELTLNGVDFMQAITDLTKLNDTETWELYNLTPDAHPMHLHLVAFQVVDRQALIDPVTGLPFAPPMLLPPINTPVNAATVGLSPAGPVAPAANELNAWKDTLFMPPGTVTRVRAKFDIPGLYVYHCHILSHEEFDMMRPYVVTTPAAAVTVASSTAGNAQTSGAVTPVTFTAAATTGIAAYPESNGFEYQFAVTSPAGVVTPLDNMTMMVPGTTMGYSFVRHATWTPPNAPGTYVVTVNAKAIGAAAVAPNVATGTLSYTIAAPAIAGITATTTAATGAVTTAGSVNVTMTFNQPVSTTGLTIALNSGATVATGPLTSVSSYTGTYTVAAGQNSAALNVTSITGTITDAAGNGVLNPAVPATTNIANSKVIIIDTTPPTLTLTAPTATVVNTTPLTVTGTATDLIGIASVTVNGTAIPVGAGGAISTTVPLVAGANTITVIATDTAGNQTTAVRTVTLDTLVPVTTATPAPGTFSGSVTVSLASSKPGATIYYTTNGTAPTVTSPVYTGPFLLTAAATAAYTVQFFAVDPAGNTELVQSAAYTVHVSDLTGSIVINGGALFVNTGTVNLTLSASDPMGVASMQFSNDGTTYSTVEPYGVAKSWPLAPGDGLKTVYVRFIDGVGTVYAPFTAQTTLDTTPPVTSATPGSGNYAGTVSVALTANETATIHYTTDGKTPTTASAVYAGPIPLNAATTSTLTLMFFAVDRAGNAEKAQSLAYTIHQPDLTGAVAINNGAATTVSQNVTLALFASDPAGATEMQVACDGATYAAVEPYATTRACTLSPGDGLKTVLVKFKDGLGYWYPPNSAQITLDTTPPVTSVTPISGTYSNNVVVTFSANEPATIYYTIDGTDPKAANNTGLSVYKAPFTLTSTTTKVFVVRYYALDQAGNAETTGTMTYTVHVNDLVGSIAINGGSHSTRSTAVTLNLSATDPAGVSSMQFSNDGVNYTSFEPYATTKSWTLNGGDGLKTVYVKFKDGTGTVYAPYSAEIMLVATAATPTMGDLNGDGKVNIIDALKALQYSIGLLTPTNAELTRADVAPLVDGKPSPDGVLDTGDALMILKYTLQLASW